MIKHVTDVAYDDWINSMDFKGLGSKVENFDKAGLVGMICFTLVEKIVGADSLGDMLKQSQNACYHVNFNAILGEPGISIRLDIQ